MDWVLNKCQFIIIVMIQGNGQRQTLRFTIRRDGNPGYGCKTAVKKATENDLTVLSENNHGKNHVRQRLEGYGTDRGRQEPEYPSGFGLGGVCMLAIQ